jgi:predicted NBD/HSP70 family sugar kinase
VKGWQNVPICQHLRTVLDLPVSIANDVDCMAFAEFQHTSVSLDQNLAYVGFDEGVKVSMFLNGQLYKGSFGNAGLIVTDLLNFSHETAMLPGEILTIEGINHLFQEKLQQVTSDTRESYADILATQNHRQRFSLILERAADGLPICQEVTASMNAALAVAIANIIYVIQPDMMFIGGLLTMMPTTLFATLIEDIRQYLPALFRNRSIIRQAMLSSPYRSGIGANYHFLESYLSDPSHKLDNVGS